MMLDDLISLTWEQSSTDTQQDTRARTVLAQSALHTDANLADEALKLSG